MAFRSIGSVVADVLRQIEERGLAPGGDASPPMREPEEGTGTRKTNGKRRGTEAPAELGRTGGIAAEGDHADTVVSD